MNSGCVTRARRLGARWIPIFILMHAGLASARADEAESSGAAASIRDRATESELLLKNQMYDSGDDAIWRLAVYEPVHHGWQFQNMGGSEVLDFIGQRGALDSTAHVAELCSGMGATCRYLAERFECRVTGIDINANQVESATRTIAEQYPDLVGRIDFEQSDVLLWTPERRYDLVFTMDSMMYIKDTLAALRKAREALKPDGVLVLAEITAGPSLTGKMREFAWDVDGMVSLLTPDEYVRLLREAGFQTIEVQDVTGLARSCWETIYRVLEQWPEEQVDRVGREEHKNWLELAGVYRDAFQNGELQYSRIACVR